MNKNKQQNWVEIKFSRKIRRKSRNQRRKTIKKRSFEYDLVRKKNRVDEH